MSRTLSRRFSGDLRVRSTEQGCVEYRVHRSVNNPRSYLLYERYINEHAYRLHGESEHFRLHAVEEGIPLLESRVREFYTPVESEPALTSRALQR